jgi:hypothetical protein
MTAVGSSETTVPLYHTTDSNILEGSSGLFPDNFSLEIKEETYKKLYLYCC